MTQLAPRQPTPDHSVLETDKLRAWLMLLRKVSVLKKSVDARMNEKFGVSLSRFDVLSALERGGKDGLKAGELTKMLVVSDGNTTQVTNKLVRDGLVIRRTGEHDRRCVIYALTGAGQTLFHNMAKYNKKWVGDIFSGFDEDDVASLKHLLGKLNLDALEKIQEVI